MPNPMYGQNKYDIAAEEQKIAHLDRVHLMNVAANNLDLSSAVEGNKIVIITAAQADGTYCRLPEATASNAGMHIRVVFGIAVADSVPDVLYAADYILSSRGGNGAVREIIDLILGNSN